MKRSMSLVNKEMQIKTTMRYHHTPTRMSEFKRMITSSAGQNVEQLELSYIWGEYGTITLKTVWQFFMKLNIHLSNVTTILPLGI